MKVWQGIGTTILAILLGVFLAVSATYFILDRSILNAAQTKKALESTKIYETIRNNQFIPQLTEDISSQVTYNGALTKTDVIDSLREAFPQSTITSSTNTVVDAAYQWLNKKSPDISFSILVTDEKALFISKIDEKVTKNLEKLPVCRTLAQIEEASDNLQCIPPTSSDAVIHDAIMEEVTNNVNGIDDAITPETLGLSNAQLGNYRNLPDYLSYLWTLNLITLPFAGLIALYLIIKRRGLGLLVIGIVLLLLSISCIIAGQQLMSISLPNDAATRQFLITERNLVGDQLRLLAMWGGIASIIFGAGGIFWMNRAKRRSHKTKAASHHTEPPKTSETE